MNFSNSVTSVTPAVRNSTGFKELEDLLPADVMKKLSSIYANKNLLVVDKLKELDDVFMSLNESTLAKLPTPKSFRNLDAESQKRVRLIYYSKTMSFEAKLRGLEEIMKSLPPEKLKLIPLQADLPGLIEFDVPVLLQFNGQIETYLLRDYLKPEEFDVLKQIIEKKNVSEVSRAKLVGKLLKTAYERDAVNFPVPLSDSSLYVPDAIQRLGIHMMFSKNPFDNIERFTGILKTIRNKNIVKRRNAILTKYDEIKDWLTLSAFVRNYMVK